MYEIAKLNTDFINAVNGIDISTFQDAIRINVTITTLFHGTKTENNGVNLIFIFDSEPSAGELTELDVLIAAHTGKPVEPTALEKEISASKSAVDIAAGEARARYITVTPGQTAVYIEKEKQSKAFKDAGYPVDETGYGFVTAEKNAQSVTATVAADTVLAMSTGWKVIAANIEQTRLEYKNQISTAANINSAKALSNKAIALLNAM
jgi:hypothetical protein